MLVAATENKDGRKLLIIGLHEENMKNLNNDKPIYIRLDGGDGVHPRVEGLENWDLTILGPEDMVRFVSHVGGMTPAEEKGDF